MATLDLGKIKFVWKGTYSGATAYETDDVVGYNGSSYICVLASTGNLPTNTTYWNLLAQGSDLSALTAQGQIPYRGASGVVALAPSTSGFVLRTNGAGQNPSWDTAAGLADQSTKIDRFAYPKFGQYLSVDNGHHYIGKDGRVYFTGPTTILASGYAGTTGDSPSTAEASSSVAPRHVVLPRGAKAYKVFDFYDTSFVIDTAGRLYASGLNSSGQLGLGLLSSGPSGSTAADVTSRARFTEVVFPTHNYPQTGSTDTPVIVHVYSSARDGQTSSTRTYAIDSHGFAWVWGDNASGVAGTTDTTNALLHSPVRIPTFMATGTVNTNSAIRQNAASGIRKRIKKIVAIAPGAESFALVEKDDTTLATESGVFFWGTNTGCTAVGNTTATIYTTPQQFTRGNLNLNSGEWVVDIMANCTVNGTTSGAFTILTNTGRMLSSGINTYGVLGTGGTVDNTGIPAIVPTTTVGSGAWAVPSTWSIPSGMTNTDFSTQWTVASFTTQMETLDETWAFNGLYRYAKLANGVWVFWGTQGVTGALGHAGVGNTTTTAAGVPNPTYLSFQDSQRSENISYRSASDEFTSAALTTGNATPGFTISKLRLSGGAGQTTIGTNGAIISTVISMSNGRVYVAGTNANSQHGAADTRVSDGYFRRVRIDDAILQNGQLTISDVRAWKGQGGAVTTNGLPNIQMLLSDGTVYAWGYNGTTGQAGLTSASATPHKVMFGTMSPV
jgi:alpha-tubulin suppressor-like RCC1 family protein